MAAQVTWNGLMVRLNVNNDTRDELARVGLGSLNDLETMDDDQLKNMVEHMLRFPHPDRPATAKVYGTANVLGNLKVARYWIKIQRMTGVIPHPTNLTDLELQATRERMEELKAYKKSAEDQDVSKPPKLKKMSEWLKFWEAAQTYFNSIRGAADIPLSYVFRAEEMVDADARAITYSSNDDKYQ